VPPLPLQLAIINVARWLKFQPNNSTGAVENRNQPEKMVHRKNVEVKNADSSKKRRRTKTSTDKNVKWDKSSTGKMLNGKQRRKDKTSNGTKQQKDIRTKVKKNAE
jgi:hypothetical protein